MDDSRVTEASRSRGWSGPAPEACDVCGRPLTGSFVDGRTAFGPWAAMCPSCHRDQGGALGPGSGQLYELQADGGWLKTEG